MTATPDANMQSGQGAPVTVRVYQLASTAAFAGAEFFPLFNQDQATLKSDLVKGDSFLLAPGEKKAISLTPMDQVKAIGFFAAYRDYAKATWRKSVDIPPHQTTKIALTVGRDGLSVQSETLPPPKPAS